MGRGRAGGAEEIKEGEPGGGQVCGGGEEETWRGGGERKGGAGVMGGWGGQRGGKSEGDWSGRNLDVVEWKRGWM